MKVVLKIFSAFISLGISANAFAQAPIVQYTFEPNTRDNTNKLYRNQGTLSGYDGLIRGFINEASGMNGKAALFRGNSGFGDYIEIQNSNTLLAGKNEFTISMWLKPDEVGLRERAYQGLLGFVFERFNTEPYGYGGALSAKFCLSGYPYIDANLPGIIDKCGNGEARAPIHGAPVPLPGEYFHYALKYSNGNCASYINGKEYNAWSCSTTAKYASNNNLSIGIGDGTFNGSIPSVAVTSYFGSMDEFSIYDRALSSQELVALSASNLTTCGDSVCSVYETEYSCSVDCAKGDQSILLSDSGSLSIWKVNETVKLSPDVAPSAASQGGYPKIELAKNEIRTSQIAFRSTTNRKISVTASGEKGIGVRVLEQKAISIPKPAWPYFFTGRLFDALLPVSNGEVNAVSNETGALLLEVSTSVDTTYGEHQISLSIGDERFTIPVKVFNFALPKVPTFKTALGSGHLDLKTTSPDSSCVGKSVFDFHGAKSVSEKDLVTRAYLETYADYKVAPYHLHMGNFFTFDCNTKQFDFTKFDKALEYYIDTLGMSNVFLLRYNGLDQANGFPLCGLTIQDEGYRALLGEYFGKLASHLSTKGWLNSKGTQLSIFFDEPVTSLNSAENAEVFLTWSKGLLPASIKMAMAVNAFNIDRFKNLLDIAIFQNNPRDSISGDPEKLSEFVRRGGEAWWYQTDSHAFSSDGTVLDNLSNFWLSWKYDVKGHLYWAGDIMNRECAGLPDKANDPYHVNPWYMNKTIWGINAASLFLPPCGNEVCQSNLVSVVPSLRLSIFREGIEDFEYLSLFDSLLSKAKALGLSPASSEGLRAEMYASIAGWKALGIRDGKIIEGFRSSLRKEIEMLKSIVSPDPTPTAVPDIKATPYPAPILIEGLKTKKVKEGKKVSFKVKFADYLTLEWRRNGKIIRGWRGLSARIKRAAKRHRGSYEVCAIGTYGRTCTKGDLKVIKKS